MAKPLSIPQLRARLARQIIVFNTLLIVMSIGYYLARGFDTEEFTSLITLLTAVSAIYLGTLFQYIGNSLKIVETEPKEHSIPKTAQLIRWIIPLHFVLITSIITAKAFTQITFKEMNLLLALIEGFFGAYIGHIITTLFNLEKLKKDEE
ncbi:MAG: hypothetical protein AAFO82_19620 [Bacteroidota bacterium]